MAEDNLIFSISGIRGIYNKSLNLEITRKIGLAYGIWLSGKNKEVVIGRDTRLSGEHLQKAIMEGLNAVGCKILDLGVCATPLIVYAKKKLNTEGGVVISGSHNPPMWNGIKLLSTSTLLNRSELKSLYEIFLELKLENYKVNDSIKSQNLKNIDIASDYISTLYSNLNFERIKKENKIRVAVDTGAGAGKYITPTVLEGLGCKIKLINNDLIKNHFPREIEPIEKNLSDLINIVSTENYDVGFAHDCDADRLAIIGDDGTCYPEDTGLALIAKYEFKKASMRGEKVAFVTNLASSLIFDELAEKYNVQVVRTPVGECNLANKMDNILQKNDNVLHTFGGEGSCGGVMFPHFNNTRDGIFAAAKIIEILVDSNKSLSSLVSKLPKYYSKREHINVKDLNVKDVIKHVKEYLSKQGENVEQIDLDLRFGQDNEWFILIHPSNTEPIIRVISEAKIESLAEKILLNTAKSIKSIVEE